MTFWRGLAVGTVVGAAAIMLMSDTKTRHALSMVQEPKMKKRASRMMREIRGAVHDLMD
ncbi:MAG: hypothetical protein U1D96_09325 [Eubacteriales bacterium]|nr:hypothetical protein [Bacillota bacterium]MBV1727444.1 hypothetical protein [Desulforudis sp.]MDP3050733.1 hypothetical protein [Eubacteriales bacterium]MDQ7788803.1 hypothetical protein [Clostridia bacterium]MBU4532918.1 hypothetical protein [Bacillota bacterium]